MTNRSNEQAAPHDYPAHSARCRWTAVLLAIGLLAAVACSKNTDKRAVTSGASYVVNVDGNRADLGLPATGSVFAFTPKTLSVHPGDSVTWRLLDSGEPHSVALGSVASAAANAVDKAPPNGPNPPELQKLPLVVPFSAGDAIQAGAQPCVVVTGAVPLKNACQVHSEAAFTGSEALVSSGWLTADAPFTVKISPGASPGIFRWLCQVHTFMTATLTIVPKSTLIATPDQVAAAATATLRGYATRLKPGFDAVSGASVGKATAGAFLSEFPEGLIDAFGPANIRIPVGGTVHWSVSGPHTIYFNAPADAQQARVESPDGSVHVNPKSEDAVGGAGPGPKAGPINGGSWDGTGPHSSGFMLSFPPDNYSYSLTFTKAGTFNYQCTIHVRMKGSVTVG